VSERVRERVSERVRERERERKRERERERERRERERERERRHCFTMVTREGLADHAVRPTCILTSSYKSRIRGAQICEG
jgi:hypothetical protein